MTDELHNHIAGMVCETDEPGKPADVTELIAEAVKAEREVWVEAAMRLMSEARYLDLMIVASELREARALAAIQAIP